MAELNAGIGETLNSWYTGRAQKSREMDLTPTIDNVTDEKKALVTVVCTCILGSQLGGRTHRLSKEKIYLTLDPIG